MSEIANATSSIRKKKIDSNQAHKYNDFALVMYTKGIEMSIEKWQAEIDTLINWEYVHVYMLELLTFEEI